MFNISVHRFATILACVAAGFASQACKSGDGSSNSGSGISSASDVLALDARKPKPNPSPTPTATATPSPSPSPTSTGVLNTGNLLEDPGFESSLSNFAAGQPTTAVSRITSGAISGTASLRADIGGWGDSIWWMKTVSNTTARHGATSLEVSALLRAEIVSSSQFGFCAFVYYVGSNTSVQKCAMVSATTTGNKGRVTATLALDTSRDLESVKVRLYQEGSQAVRFALDDASVILYGVGPIGTSPTPTPTATATPLPSPSPSPTSTSTPPPAPVVDATLDSCHNAALQSASLFAVPAAFNVPVTLQRNIAGGDTISFGVPVGRAKLRDPRQVQVVRTSDGTAIAGARVKAILCDVDIGAQANSNVNVVGVRSVLVQLPAAVMGSVNTLGVTVRFNQGDAGLANASVVAFSVHGASSPEAPQVADRSIVLNNGVYSLVESNVRSQTVFPGFEPRVIARFADGYLAGTGILGTHQMSETQLAAKPKLAGLRYFSDNFKLFTKSQSFNDGYKMNPSSLTDYTVQDVNASLVNYEGWLYDRCATFLTTWSHYGDLNVYRHALRACSYYSSKINSAGYCTIKPDLDVKYSHLRGVYAYYALTGDERAFQAGKDMARMWRDEPLFVASYRQGTIAGVGSLWTERLLGTSLEGLIYGTMLTLDRSFIDAFRQILNTAYIHITATNQNELNTLTKTTFPAQNCFIHSANQHSEDGNPATAEPWCSSWMSELVIDALLRFQDLTADARVDEIFIRLNRFLRDVGTTYALEYTELQDKFLQPSVCYLTNPANYTQERFLVPVYGSGLFADGTRYLSREADVEHCSDATALTAVGIRALVRKGTFSQNPIGPFASEGASFMGMHHEFSRCAKYFFEEYHRTGRDPRLASSSFLSSGYSSGNVSQQATWLNSNKIGYPSYHTAPLRKLSWWFNTAMLQFGVLDEAGVDFSTIIPGQVQPAGKTCN